MMNKMNPVSAYFVKESGSATQPNSDPKEYMMEEYMMT